MFRLRTYKSEGKEVNKVLPKLIDSTIGGYHVVNAPISHIKGTLDEEVVTKEVNTLKELQSLVLGVNNKYGVEVLPQSINMALAEKFSVEGVYDARRRNDYLYTWKNSDKEVTLNVKVVLYNKEGYQESKDTAFEIALTFEQYKEYTKYKRQIGLYLNDMYKANKGGKGKAIVYPSSNHVVKHLKEYQGYTILNVGYLTDLTVDSNLIGKRVQNYIDTSLRDLDCEVLSLTNMIKGGFLYTILVPPEALKVVEEYIVERETFKTIMSKVLEKRTSIYKANVGVMYSLHKEENTTSAVYSTYPIKGLEYTE